MADRVISEIPTGLADPLGSSIVANAPASRSGFIWRKNLEIVLPAAGLIFMVLACFLGPVIFPIPGPNSGIITSANLPPLTIGHWLGTDPVGNDELSRILYGGRISLEVGVSSVLIGLSIGSFLGMLAGLKGGWVETIIMRCLDLLLSFPGLIIALVIATYLGPSELHVIYAISFVTIPGNARLARAHTLRLRELNYVVAARFAGRKDRSILLRHIAPNVYPNLLTFSILGIGIAIVIEASLSFLGLGVPPPQPSWGNLISAGQNDLSLYPYLVLEPAAFLFFTAMCFNLLSDALRARWSSQ